MTATPQRSRPVAPGKKPSPAPAPSERGAPGAAAFLLSTAAGRRLQRCACSDCRCEDEELPVQRKALPALEVGPADDAYEREADRAADRVMRAPAPPGMEADEGAGAGRPAADLQRRAEGHTPAAAPPAVHSALRTEGRPLDPGTRAFMELRFGQDFGHVRVHTGRTAEESARAVSAAAYTVGSSVVFGAGRYRPGAADGRRLLAHELAHVVQQQGSRPRVQRATDPVVLEPVRSGARACLVHLHGDETEGRAVAEGLYRDRCVNLVYVDHPGRRLLRVDVPGHAGVSCRADPNRIFQDSAITGKWGEWNTGACLADPVKSDAQQAVRDYRDHSLQPAIRQCRGQAATAAGADATGVAGPLPVVSFHNNRPAPSATPPVRRRGSVCREDLTIRSYLPGHCEEAATETDQARTDGHPNPNIAPGQDIDDFILVTNKADFLTLRATRNVVLQSTSPPRDGSLSVVLSSGRYVNVEAEKGGPVATNRSLGDEALDSIGVPPGRCQTAGGGASSSPSSAAPAVQRQEITGADLRRRQPAELDRFARAVYDRQVRIWVGRGATFVGEVPASELTTLPAGDTLPGRTVRLHREVATRHLQPMLEHARRDLAAARAAGVPSAARVTDLRVRSGYRPAREQLSIWEREFPNYYRATAAHRRTLPGGEHGAAAADYLAEYINQRVFSPGYSPHQRGQTVDLTYREGGTWAQADTDPAAIAAWRSSWFFSWLQQHAPAYGFLQNPDLDEPWHWEFSELLVLLLQLVEWLREVIQRIRRALGIETEEERAPAEAPSTPAPQE